MNKSNKALREDYPLCNCDGFWHVEINGLTHYVDISPVTNHIKELPSMQMQELLTPYDTKEAIIQRDWQMARNKLRQQLINELEEVK